MLRNNADARRCSYFELGPPVISIVKNRTHTDTGLNRQWLYWITSLKYILKSVNGFAFTNKLKLVMKGNEHELWIASLTTCNFITVQS